MLNLSSVNDLVSLVKMINHELMLKKYSPINIAFLKKVHEYRTKKILKKDGSYRELSIPDTTLLHVQEVLLDFFYDYQRISKSGKWVAEIDRAVPAYKPSTSSIKSKTVPAHLIHARNHVNKSIIVSFDFHDFFNTIGFNKIYGVYNKYFNCSPHISFILTNLTTFKNSLPQGAPTSPFLSNLAMYQFDKKMINLSRRNGVKYSRYADDIVLSSNDSLFLNNKNFFEYPVQNRQDIKFSDYISNLLSDYKLSLNKNKTRVYNYWNQQKITGIVVNRHINISRRDLVIHRSILINLIKSLDIKSFSEVEGSRQLNNNINKAIAMFKIDTSFIDENNQNLELLKDLETVNIFKVKLIHFILFSKTQYYVQILSNRSRRIEKIMLLSNRLNLLLNNIINDENISFDTLPTTIMNKIGLNNNCTFYFESD